MAYRSSIDRAPAPPVIPFDQRLFDQTFRQLVDVTEPPDLGGVLEPPSVDEKTLEDLDWCSLVAEVASQTRTPEGHELAATLVPFQERSLVQRRFDEVGEMLLLLKEEKKPPITGLKDLRESLATVAVGSPLTAIELAAVCRNLDMAARIRSFFVQPASSAARLRGIATLIEPCSDLLNALIYAIEPGGHISDNASPDLRNYRRAVVSHTERLREEVDILLQSHDVEPHLQDDYYTMRDGRYVVPVRASAKTVVEGIIHGYSNSGQTAFVEPTILIQRNNALRVAQEQVEEEERAILQHLSQLTAKNLEALRFTSQLIAYLDLIHAIARFSLLIQGTIPTLRDPPSVAITERSVDAVDKVAISEEGLYFQQLRHPLLYLKYAQQQGEEDVNPSVGNDVRMDGAKKILVISGPNTGGKTVLLKAIGCAIVMAKSGLPVAAKVANTPFFGHLYSDIGDQQSIEKDLSTFSAHLLNINRFLPRCGPDTVVLLDELFTGTDPVQGAALASALLEDLAIRHTTTFVTTHLDGLKTLALENDLFANASMGFDLETLSPTYLLTLGVPGSSFAFRIADRLGFPPVIIEQAVRRLEAQGSLLLDDAMAQLENQANELRAETNRLQHQRVRAEKAERRYQREFEKLAAREMRLVSKQAHDLQEQLQMAERVVRDKIRELQVDENLQRKDLEHLRETFRMQQKVITEVKQKTEERAKMQKGMLPVPFDLLEENMTVYASTYKRNAIVLRMDEGRQRAHIQIGSLKAFAQEGELFYLPEATPRVAGLQTGERGATALAGNAGGPAPGRVQEKGEEEPQWVKGDVLFQQTTDNSIDLRGLRPDEAVEKTDLFVDRAIRQGIDGVYVIHGFGTGALRDAIRGYLSKNTRVRTFRPGKRKEGGNGVTIAYVGDRHVSE